MNTTMVDEKEKNCKNINNNTLAAEARETQGLRCSSSVPRLSPWTRSGETPAWECLKGRQNINHIDNGQGIFASVDKEQRDTCAKIFVSEAKQKDIKKRPGIFVTGEVPA